MSPLLRTESWSGVPDDEIIYIPESAYDNGFLDPLGAVSYTHLDVYKRQHYYSYENLDDFVQEISPATIERKADGTCLLYTST